MWRGLAALGVLGGSIMCMGMGCSKSTVRYEAPAVRRTIPFETAAGVRAKIPSGQITIHAWDESTVTAEVVVWAQARSQERAEQLAQDAKVELARAGEAIVLECKPVGQRSGELVGARVLLHVPMQAGSQVEVEAPEAPASAPASGTTERVRKDVGDIKLHDCTRPVSAETDTGSIEISRAAASVDCKVDTGNVVLREIQGPAKVEVDTGEVKLTTVRGPVKASTDCGSIAISDAYSYVDATTDTGSIRIQNPHDAVKARSDTGEIRLDAGAGCWKGREITLSTDVGRIDVSLVTR